MPDVPKWVADQMENLLPSKYLEVEVTATIKYSPEIKKITFNADLSKLDFYPGCSMIFRAGNHELRHYTPSDYNQKAGTFEILFHIHGNGPGSDLAERLLPGDRLKVGAPGGKKMYNREKTFHFFFGDETSLSFYIILLKEVNQNKQLARGIFELTEPNLLVPEDLGFDIKTVPITPEDPAREAISLLESSMTEKPELFHQSIFYLTGNVASVQRVRAVLKKKGISSKNIKLQGYWAKGSVGL